MHVVPPVQILALDPRHVAFAARLHADALRSGLFPRFGPRFLAAYYRTFLDSPFGIAFVALAGSSPIGMLVGTTDNAAHYRWVLRHRVGRLGLTLLAALVVRPRVAWHFARTRLRRYARGSRLLVRSRRAAPSMAAAVAPERRRAVLTHVAVLPAARGTGAGRRLVEDFCTAVAGEDDPVIAVVTAAGPEGAQAFYERLGWRVDDEAVDADGEAIVRLHCPA